MIILGVKYQLHRKKKEKENLAIPAYFVFSDDQCF